MPSFVITLAGLLALLGVQLLILKGQNAINIPFDSGLVNFAQLWFVPAWLSYLLVVIAAAGLFVAGWRALGRAAGTPAWRRSRRSLIVVRSVALLVALVFAVYYLNQHPRRGLDVRALRRCWSWS